MLTFEAASDAGEVLMFTGQTDIATYREGLSNNLYRYIGLFTGTPSSAVTPEYEVSGYGYSRKAFTWGTPVQDVDSLIVYVPMQESSITFNFTGSGSQTWGTIRCIGLLLDSTNQEEKINLLAFTQIPEITIGGEGNPTSLIVTGLRFYFD